MPRKRAKSDDVAIDSRLFPRKTSKYPFASKRREVLDFVKTVINVSCDIWEIRRFQGWK
jgi:hypothetical protein